jgi:uncharacterized protein YjlB
VYRPTLRVLRRAASISLAFLALHGPDGQDIEINSTEIVAIRAPRGLDHVHHDIHCLVFTTDGKFTAVQETCDSVQKMVNQAADPDRG